MARRKTRNVTTIKRIEGIPYRDAWVSFTCIRCSHRNFVNVGLKLLHPKQAYEEALWPCEKCGYIHSRSSDLPEMGQNREDLPFKSWGVDVSHLSIHTQRFWKAFFTTATENRQAYWKQCNTCGKILPAAAFSGHVGWGPLEKQMECRSCKAVINAELNPKRSIEQLHESSLRRRIGDLMFEDENEEINLEELFATFQSKCFKTGKLLDSGDRRSWAVDHLLPSRYLYPLTKNNAVLLSREANENKRDRWPSEFYANKELIKLADLIGANLDLISSAKPIVNANIDVNKCVDRLLTVRDATPLNERVKVLKKIIETNRLVARLTPENRAKLGL